MEDLKKIVQLIDKWKLNKAFLAKKMGMLRGTFSNKINPTHYTNFSDVEIEKLKGILIKMRDDFKNL